MQIKLSLITCLMMTLYSIASSAQASLITDVTNRNSTSLNGKWQYIVDPYETGFFDYRYNEWAQDNPAAYWNDDQPVDKTTLKEFGYTNKYILDVPGDWNHQHKELLYYEGTVWYKKSFDYLKRNKNNKLFLYFGAVNYRADVYLNGRKLGVHIGGFTPFNFQIPDSILKNKGNTLVVRVNNTRHADDVPTLNTDWWNYGGITRSVLLIEEPQTFIQDYFIHLKKEKTGSIPSGKNTRIEGWIHLNRTPEKAMPVTISIPELHFKKQFITSAQSFAIEFSLPKIELWSPEHPKLYYIVLATRDDSIGDKIGFRIIEASHDQLLLNGNPIFLRGIAIHEEIPQEQRRAWSKKDALQLLNQARALNCNMVRLAHYPHDESMVRLADSLGILVWSEIPVYWTINFKSAEVYNNAEKQLDDMITRDHNRASIIIWSVGNETPISKDRTHFMSSLVKAARQMDNTRIISAALQIDHKLGKDTSVLDDPLGAYVDLLSVNEYLGWYGGTPERCRTAYWKTSYDKPFFISETGAGAKFGFHADPLTRFSEEYQAWYYKEQIKMFNRMPRNWVGLSPWIMADFRSPKRNNPVYQDGWNRKGLYDDKGNRKKAFYILRQYYEDIKSRYAH